MRVTYYSILAYFDILFKKELQRDIQNSNNIDPVVFNAKYIDQYPAR